MHEATSIHCTAPIVICGMQGSGTTLVGKFLR